MTAEERNPTLPGVEVKSVDPSDEISKAREFAARLILTPDERRAFAAATVKVEKACYALSVATHKHRIARSEIQMLGFEVLHARGLSPHQGWRLVVDADGESRIVRCERQIQDELSE